MVFFIIVCMLLRDSVAIVSCVLYLLFFFLRWRWGEKGGREGKYFDYK